MGGGPAVRVRGGAGSGDDQPNGSGLHCLLSGARSSTYHTSNQPCLEAGGGHGGVVTGGGAGGRGSSLASGMQC